MKHRRRRDRMWAGWMNKIRNHDGERKETTLMREWDKQEMKRKMRAFQCNNLHEIEKLNNFVLLLSVLLQSNYCNGERWLRWTLWRAIFAVGLCVLLHLFFVFRFLHCCLFSSDLLFSFFQLWFVKFQLWFGVLQCSKQWVINLIKKIQ